MHPAATEARARGCARGGGPLFGPWTRRARRADGPLARTDDVYVQHGGVGGGGLMGH